MIGPLTNSIIDNIFSKIKKKKNKKIIMVHIIEPLLCDIKTKCHPYIILFFIFLLIIIILLLILIFKKNKYICEKCKNSS